MESLIMIGQFSEMTATSKRMLRHYDKMNILKPVEINQDNGYRYYNHNQISLLYTIKLLQGFGFSLAEISQIIKQPTKQVDFLDMLKDKEAYLRNQIDSDVTKLLRIRKSIEILNTTKSEDLLIELHSLDLERSSTIMEDKISKEHLALQPTENPQIQGMRLQLYALPGSMLFEEHMSDYHTKHPSEPLTFLTFDLDNFMPINDLYGFDVGDSVIYKYYDLLAQIFNPLIQDGRGIVARLGGDEIAYFLHDITLDAITNYVQEALEAIRSYDFSTFGCNRKITSSCGLYYTSTVVNVAELRHNCTKALMEGKRLGRNQLFSITN